MIVERVSTVSGKKHTMDLNVTQEQIDAWKSGKLIQDAMPQLTRAEREFIMTGVTDEEWKELWDSVE